MTPEASDPRGRPLLTPAEAKAKAVLDEIYEHQGHSVLPGFKLSQVIRSRPPGITSEQWNYATRAHFDFVVTDCDYRVEFAVELDDRSHDTADGLRRDAMKNSLCEAVGLELLRVEFSALFPGPRGRRLIEYLIAARDLGQAFVEQQEVGAIPWYEPYDYRNFIELGPNGHLDFVNDLAAPTRLAALRAHESGQIAESIVHGLHFYWKNGWAEGWAWLRCRGDRYFFRSTRLRTYRFFCGMGPGELAEDLSVAALGEDLAALGKDAPVLVRGRDIQERWDSTLTRAIDLESARCLSHTSMRFS